jgi:hypothetical protein
MSPRQRLARTGLHWRWILPCSGCGGYFFCRRACFLAMMPIFMEACRGVAALADLRDRFRFLPDRKQLSLDLLHDIVLAISRLIDLNHFSIHEITTLTVTEQRKRPRHCSCRFPCLFSQWRPGHQFGVHQYEKCSAKKTEKIRTARQASGTGFAVNSPGSAMTRPANCVGALSTGFGSRSRRLLLYPASSATAADRNDR